jgi:hypothetical protein
MTWHDEASLDDVVAFPVVVTPPVVSEEVVEVVGEVRLRVMWSRTEELTKGDKGNGLWVSNRLALFWVKGYKQVVEEGVRIGRAKK